MSSGISSRQGSHHVARRNFQPSTTFAAPISAEEIAFPFRSFTRNGGIAVGLFTKRMTLGGSSSAPSCLGSLATGALCADVNTVQDSLSPTCRARNAVTPDTSNSNPGDYHLIGT